MVRFYSVSDDKRLPTGSGKSVGSTLAALAGVARDLFFGLGADLGAEEVHLDISGGSACNAKGWQEDRGYD